MPDSQFLKIFMQQSHYSINEKRNVKAYFKVLVLAKILLKYPIIIFNKLVKFNTIFKFIFCAFIKFRFIIT